MTLCFSETKTNKLPVLNKLDFVLAFYCFFIAMLHWHWQVREGAAVLMQESEWKSNSFSTWQDDNSCSLRAACATWYYLVCYLWVPGHQVLVLPWDICCHLGIPGVPSFDIEPSVVSCTALINDDPTDQHSCLNSEFSLNILYGIKYH